MYRSRGVQATAPLWFLPLLIGAISVSSSIASARQSATNTASDRVWVGKKATAFTLPGMDGKPVNIAKDLGKRPVVLVFYRAIW